MVRWFIVVFLGLILINWLSPWLQRIGFGRLPGDFKFRWLGRDWFLPVTSTIALSAAISLVSLIV